MKGKIFFFSSSFLMLAISLLPCRTFAQKNLGRSAVDEEQSALEAVNDIRNEENSTLKEEQRLTRRNPFLRPYAWTLPEKGYEGIVQISGFNTTSYYDEQGNEIALNEGESFSKLDTDVILSYGIKDQIEFSLGGRYRQNTDRGNDFEVTESGGESVMGALRYRFAREKGQRWIYTINLEYRKTLYSNADYAPGAAPTDQLVLGDDGASVMAQLQLSFLRTSSHSLDFNIGHRSPGTGLSSEVPYMARSYWTWEQLGLGLGVRGVYSLSTDDDEADPANRRAMSTGHTHLFNSVNRQWVTPFVNAKWSFERLSLFFDYSMVMSGVSTDKGYQWVVGLAWDDGGLAPEEKKLSEFKEYVIEASVIKVSPRGHFIKIDHGQAQYVSKGTRFDIFKTDYFGGNVLVAEAIAYEVGSDWAILKVVKSYRNMTVEKGNAARSR